MPLIAYFYAFTNIITVVRRFIALNISVSLFDSLYTLL